MKRFFRTRLGRRLLCVPVLLALAVATGFLLRGFVGPQSEMWQRSVFCLATFGTGLSALFFVLLGWWGFLAGYGLLLIRELPDLLPKPWDTVAFSLLFYSFGFTGQINYVLDDIEPTRCKAVVEEMQISASSKGWDLYKLTVVLPDGQTQELHVKEQLYEQTEVGDTITIATYNGAIDIPYTNVSR